ncbi:hypothetical protein [Thermococcus sp. 18S1]|nr:hypothetical protein [Thermococcus sp. 18S1]
MGRSWRNLPRGIIRVHAGFAVIRVNSLGIIYPKRTNANIAKRLRRKG